MSASAAAVTAFREAYVSAGDENSVSYEFDSMAARRLRYALYQALYDNSIYRSSVHPWSASYRQQLGLYRYIRSIESPAAQIITFWQTHLFGGSLDPAAGDGSATQSALPILTDTEALRVAIAQLWQWSNWQVKKDVFALQGATLGDIGIKVVDDRARQKVYLQLVHPSTVCGLDLDPFGNVKGYAIEEPRMHPTTGKTVTYREVVSRDGDSVRYQTELNNEPYAWPDNVDASGTPRQEWREPYGFVPFVWLNHIDIGGEFGLSELHQGLPTFRELDDIASALDDQIRKAVNAPWLMAGVDDPKKAGKTDPKMTTAAATATKIEPGRQEMPLLYGPVGATATPLVFPLDIMGVNTRIEAQHAKLRRDYSELEADIATSAGDASGRALRVARQKAETKVLLRRGTYDGATARAQQMAVAIGGMRRLPGFEPFNLDSFASGALDHRIGSRPVFAVSTMDEIEEDQAFWMAAKAATDTGYPLELYLADKGWAQQKIDAYQAARLARAVVAQQISGPPAPPVAGQQQGGE